MQTSKVPLSAFVSMKIALQRHLEKNRVFMVKRRNLRKKIVRNVMCHEKCFKQNHTEQQ